MGSVMKHTLLTAVLLTLLAVLRFMPLGVNFQPHETI